MIERRKRLEADPEKTRAWQDRSRKRAAEKARSKPKKALPRESSKRKSERGERSRIVAEVRARGCVARELVPEIPCGGVIDGHEIVPRSLYPGGHLDRSNVVGVCRIHHGWIDDHPAEAVTRGLSGHSWDPQMPNPTGG